MMEGQYRKNVGIVLCKKGKVLLFARADQEGFQWQFPQGGVEENENIVEAAKRELKEETGLSHVKLLYVMPESIKYDFPKKIVKNWNTNNPSKKSKYIGQDQQWVLFDFCGEDEEIDFFTHPEEIEFKAFKWADISEAVENVVCFKKEVYQKVSDCFKPFIEENKDE